MKKVLFFLAIVFATVSFAQQGQNLGPIPCPPCPTTGYPVVVYPQPVPSQTIISKQKPKLKKVYVPSRPTISISNTNSGNYTVNNYYREPAPQSTYTNYADWMLPLLLLILWLLILFGLVLLFKKEPPAPTHVTVAPAPAAPSPAPGVVVPASSEEIEKALAHAKESGGTFSRSKDGGYSVEFPKPEKLEEKNGTSTGKEKSANDLMI